MASFRKKGRKHDPYCVLVLQYCRKCYPVDVCNPQRRPGFHSRAKPWFNYLYSQLNSHWPKKKVPCRGQPEQWI